MRIGKSLRKVIRWIVVTLGLFFFLFILLFPFFWMFITSIKPNSELYDLAQPPLSLYKPTLEHYVYLIENGKLIRREVSIARHEKNSVIIDEGLSNGDTLVVELLQGVAPGMPAKSRQAIEVENIS